MNNYLLKLLEVYWLRPETALWRTFDCMLMEKYGAITGRSIDLGCGDGIMSFLMAGGEFHEYDVFMDVTDASSYISGTDIHNQVFSMTPRANFDNVRYSYEYGLDHKQNLINKAKRLAPFYKKNQVADLNQSISFREEYFDTAFSNILYWLDNIDATLSEWNRILRNNGRLYLFVPNSNFMDKAWLYYSAPHALDKRFYNYFDRGYSPLIKQYRGTLDWVSVFARNGFEVIDHHLYLTDPVIDIWNIGTRPIAQLLINMTERLSLEGRKEAKTEWVDYFANFLQPIIDEEFERKVSERDAAFHFFVLEKK